MKTLVQSNFGTAQTGVLCIEVSMVYVLTCFERDSVNPTGYCGCTKNFLNMVSFFGEPYQTNLNFIPHLGKWAHMHTPLLWVGSGLVV